MTLWRGQLSTLLSLSPFVPYRSAQRTGGWALVWLSVCQRGGWVFREVLLPGGASWGMLGLFLERAASEFGSVVFPPLTPLLFSFCTHRELAKLTHSQAAHDVLSTTETRTADEEFQRDRRCKYWQKHQRTRQRQGLKAAQLLLETKDREVHESEKGSCLSSAVRTCGHHSNTTVEKGWPSLRSFWWQILGPRWDTE